MLIIAISVPSNATFVDGVQGMTGSVALWGNCGMLQSIYQLKDTKSLHHSQGSE
jgi:hypothetical protein